MWMFLYSSEINLSLGWTWQFLAINSNTVFDIYDMKNEMSDCNSGRFESSSLEKWYSQVMLCQNHKRIVKLWVKWRSIGLEWWIKVLCFGRSHLPWSNSQKWPECFLVSPSVQCFQLHPFPTAPSGWGAGHGVAAVPSVGQLSLPHCSGDGRRQHLLACWHYLGCGAWLDHNLGWRGCREYFLLQLND